MPERIKATAILGTGCLWLIVAAGCVSAAEEPPAVPTSPRLLALAAQVRGGDAASVGKLWNEIAKQGTPLVEPAPADVNLALVTFLWRGDPGTRALLGVHRRAQLRQLARDAVRRADLPAEAVGSGHAVGDVFCKMKASVAVL